MRGHAGDWCIAVGITPRLGREVAMRRLSAVAVHHIAGAIDDTATNADCVPAKVCDPVANRSSPIATMATTTLKRPVQEDLRGHRKSS
jgi:hypothetical protein